MAKKYRTSKYSVAVNYGKWKTSSYFRQTAYKKYSKHYDKMYEKYGRGMAEKLTKEDFYKLVRDDFNKMVASDIYRKKFRPEEYAEASTFQTLKESRAGARNFNRNIKELQRRVLSGEATDKDIELFDKLRKVFEGEEVEGIGPYRTNKWKINSTEIRSNSEKWEKILYILDEMNVTEQTMGSK